MTGVVDPERLRQGSADELSETILSNHFDAHNIINVESEEVADNYQQDKAIHQLVDYTGIDFLIDPFDGPIFGVNHRIHSPADKQLRFDLRSDTGTEAPSELDKLKKAEPYDIVPKYASRMKQTADGYEWFKIVELKKLVGAIKSGLQPDYVHETPDGQECWFFEYELLNQMGVVEQL